MAAGLGFKTFNTGDVLSAADTNGYLMQGVLVFADAAARSAAITSPQEGQTSYLKDTDVIQVYSGSAWVTKSGGSSPLTTKGDLYTYSTTDARLPVGTNGHTLVADSAEATGLKWAAPAGGGGYTYVGGATFTSSSSTSVNDVFSSTYQNYKVIFNFTTTVSDNIYMQLRVSGSDNSTSNYDTQNGSFGGTGSAANRDTGLSFFVFAGMGANPCIADILIGSPFATAKTSFFNSGLARGNDLVFKGGNFTSTTSFTGFTFYPQSGNMTGTVRVYGLANS
jgi:hypothetical protein